MGIAGEDVRGSGSYMNESQLRKLKDPHFRFRLALHEAGHLVYAIRYGATHCTFHAAKGNRAAAVQMVFPPGSLEVGKTAKYAAAGGVVVRTLVQLSEDEKDSDADDFKIFETGLRKSGYSREQIQDIWIAAQNAIAQELRNPKFREFLTKF